MRIYYHDPAPGIARRKIHLSNLRQSAKSADYFFFLWMVTMLIGGCARPALDARSVTAADPAAGLVLDVPFLPQNDYDCGPKSLAMVLAYHGLPADPEGIAEQFHSEAVAGVFTIDLLIAATEAGADAHWVKADWDKLTAELNAGRPAVVFMNRAVNPLPARHFAAAVGWARHGGRDFIVLHDGQEAFKAVEQREFDRMWSRTGRMMLTVKPKENQSAK